MTTSALAPGTVRLLPGTYDRRRRVNRDYLVSLDERALVQNHRIEAGIGDQGWHLKPSVTPGVETGWGRHWGWETPGALLRGHFVGHWMSAAAREVAVTGDPVLRGKLSVVLDELEACQDAGEGWVFGIPRTFLRRLAEGREVWAPQYNIHKTFMGLVDVHRDLGDERALRIAHRAAGVLAEWARAFGREEFQALLEVETGGMLEVWADLLEATGDDELYRDLLDRYDHRSLFDGLLAGEDMLTNMHANTTIPEVLGAARAFEVTGEERWRRIVEAYWDWAVTRRGTFCTGGQTSGEIWTPPFAFAARRGAKTQEHCAVYNMIRLADVLYRWTGDASYLDYIEANLVNGILAQQHPGTGMVSYFLPLQSGARKEWGSPTEDFWCCHGTLVQAHTRHASLAVYAGAEVVTIAQYIPVRADVATAAGELAVEVRTLDDALYVGPDANAGPGGSTHRPHALRVSVVIESAPTVRGRVRMRVPVWTVGDVHIRSDAAVVRRDRFMEIDHPGGRTEVELGFGFELRTVPIPDEPATVAFVEGGVVLAGLVDRETPLVGDVGDPTSLLAADEERQWSQWLTRYRSVGRSAGIRFVPLNEVVDERFAVYFPVVTPA